MNKKTDGWKNILTEIGKVVLIAIVGALLDILKRRE